MSRYHCLVRWNVWCISNWHKLLHSFPLSLHFTRNKEEKNQKFLEWREKNCFGCFKNKLTVANSFNSELLSTNNKKIKLFFHFVKKKFVQRSIRWRYSYTCSMAIHKPFFFFMKSLTFHPLLSCGLPFCVIDFLITAFMPAAKHCWMCEGKNSSVTVFHPRKWRKLRQWKTFSFGGNFYYAIVVAVIYCISLVFFWGRFVQTSEKDSVSNIN